MSDVAGGGTVEFEELWQQFLGKLITLESKSVPGYYWHVETGGGRKGDIYLSRKSDVFRLVKGLSGEGNTVSFESVLQPGYYLRWKRNERKIKPCICLLSWPKEKRQIKLEMITNLKRASGP